MDQVFLEKVSALFIDNGAKTLTMDDIAREFGMSKKTLYQKYANKESLLEDVLTYQLELVIAKLNKLDEEVQNAIERMFCRDEHIENAVRSNNSLLIRQLIRYYPIIFTKHMRKFSEKFSDVMVNNVERGREQGYYRTNFDAKIYAKIFFQLVMSYHSSPMLDTSEYPFSEYKDEVMMMYMNAITTEKGKKYLEKYTQ